MISAAETSQLKGLIADFHPYSLVVTNPNLEDNPIVYVNRAFERVTGYHSSAVIGRNCRFLQGKDTNRETVSKMRNAIKKREPVTVNLLNYRADGEPFWNNLHLEPVYDDSGENLMCFLGVQKVLEEEPAPEGQGIDQQLREIQHRVKNHLQMIVSMIRMQATSGTTAEDEYRSLSRRVEALQILYSEMHGDEDDTAGDTIMLGAYLSRIATAISYLESSNEIQLNMNLDPFPVRIDTAGRVGLIMSEILTNSYQHAFKDRSTGVIDLSLQKLSSGVIRLQITDDGIGLAKDSDWPNTGSMGAKIVQSLISGINAELTITRPYQGTTFTIDLPPVAEASHDK